MKEKPYLSEISKPNQDYGQCNGGPDKHHVREIQDVHQFPDLGECAALCLLGSQVAFSIHS